jgi:hypothetical protein
MAGYHLNQEKIMRIGCFEACDCVTSCYQFVTQGITATVMTLDKIRRDPGAFQKVFIVAASIIRGFNFHCKTNMQSQFIEILDAAPTFDFYGIFRLPRYFLHPYAPTRFDEYAILDQLEVILCNNWHLGIPDVNDKNRDQSVFAFAKAQLNVFLEKMVEADEHFRTEEEVKTILQHWLEKTLEANPQEDFDPHLINLKDLQISLKRIPWTETIANVVFVITDIVCVPAFLQSWRMVNLAPYAKAIGNFPLFAWLPDKNLDDWVWAGLSLANLLQFIHAAHSLWNRELTPAEAKDAKWLMVASVAESIYALTVHQKSDPKIVNCLALIAKLIGLVAFLVASEPTFFNDG